MTTECGILVDLEGLSGTGKTTVAPLVARQLGAVLTTSVMSPHLAWAHRVDASLDPTSRYLFFLSAVARTAALLQPLLDRGVWVITDRWLATTQVFHAFLGVRTIPDAMLPLRRPEATILIDCAETERIRRMRQRGMTANDAIELAPGAPAKLRDLYAAHVDAVVDSTDRSPEQVAQEIVDWLMARHGSPVV